MNEVSWQRHSSSMSCYSCMESSGQWRVRSSPCGMHNGWVIMPLENRYSRRPRSFLHVVLQTDHFMSKLSQNKRQNFGAELKAFINAAVEVLSGRRVSRPPRRLERHENRGLNNSPRFGRAQVRPS
jgi:hypothetical protein